MSHRTTPVDSADCRRTTIARAAVLAAALLAAPGRAGAVRPPPTTASVSTTSTDWDRRITAALLGAGTVDAVVADLAKVPADAPGIRPARVRAAVEAGDLTAALAALQDELQQPAPPATHAATLTELAGGRRLGA